MTLNPDHLPDQQVDVPDTMTYTDEERRLARSVQAQNKSWHERTSVRIGGAVAALGAVAAGVFAFGIGGSEKQAPAEASPSGTSAPSTPTPEVSATATPSASASNPETTTSGVSIEAMSAMEVEDFVNLTVNDRVKWAQSEILNADEFLTTADAWKASGAHTYDIVKPSANNTPLQAYEMNNLSLQLAAYLPQTPDNLALDIPKAQKYVSALFDDTEYAKESMQLQLDFIETLEGPTNVPAIGEALDAGERIDDNTVAIKVSERGNTFNQVYRFVDGIWVFSDGTPVQ